MSKIGFRWAHLGRSREVACARSDPDGASQSHPRWPTAGLPISRILGRRWDVFITRSDFRSEAIFGFLNPNYRGHVTYFFCKTSKWPRLAILKISPRKSAFQVSLSELRALFELNTMWNLYARRANSDARYQRKSSNLSTFFGKIRAHADQLDFLN